MIDKIKVGISQKLNVLFGDEYRIYTEEIKQGLKPPAFFIKTLNPSQTQILGRRYQRTYPFDIHFFPSENGAEAEQCESITDQLFSELEYITVDGNLTRGTGMNAEVVNGVLHFFIQYNSYVLKPETPQEYMDDITQSSYIKR
ncbi:phage tail terminator family protein [Thermotalea metallivorans]|uniref:Phage protein n=1 Tax=Thermotalea metallivorans TaxID=520762 RepID=A0A140LCL0_9FIRM|nr:hypothetical protein [Thermotalea metallivorans]KXG78285.1 hypothetical protein AN619_02600 [Thermotalea metallivorans]